MDKAGLLGEIAPQVWTIDWNVNCQAVGDGAASLQYLARYVFKVAISESRILRVDDTEVLFQYRKPHSNRARTMRLPIAEFMRRFLQHVLPRGLMKVRYYGFLSPSCAVPLEELRARIEMAQGFARSAPEAKIVGSSGGMNEAWASCQNGVSRNAEAHQVRQRYRVVRDTPTSECKRSNLRAESPMRMAEIRTTTAAR